MKYSLHGWLCISLLTCCLAQLKPCSRKDPQINVCIKDLFNSIYQNARFGRSEFNAASNDVIQMDNLFIESKDLDMKAYYESVYGKGFKDLKIIEVKSDINKLRIDVKFLIPRIEFRSIYEMAGGGKVVGFAFTSKGKNSILVDKMVGIMKLHMSRQQKGNENFLIVENSALDYNYAKSYQNYEDSKNPVIGPILSTIANENPQLFFDEFKKPLSNTLAATLKKIFQNVLSSAESNYFVD